MIPKRGPEKWLPDSRITAGAKITEASIHGGNKESWKRYASKECIVYIKTELVLALASHQDMEYLY